MSDKIETRVIRLVRSLFLGGDQEIEVSEEMSLIDSGICDSMGLVQLATAIEKEFGGVRIDDQDITHKAFGSVAAIARLLRKSGVAE